jgi:hypothetical protein
LNIQPVIDILQTEEFKNLSDADAAALLEQKTVVISLTENNVETWITDRTLAGLFTYERAAEILSTIDSLTIITDAMTNEQKKLANGFSLILQQLRDHSGTPPGLSIASKQAPSLIMSIVGLGIATQDEANILSGMASETVSWYSANNINPLHAGDINYLRNGGKF